MERNYLICMLVGQFVAKDSSINSEDLRIKIDQALTKACMTTLGTEEGDIQLLNELLGETMIYVIGQGINRKQRRS